MTKKWPPEQNKQQVVLHRHHPSSLIALRVCEQQGSCHAVLLLLTSLQVQFHSLLGGAGHSDQTLNLGSKSGWLRIYMILSIPTTTKM